MRRGLISLLLLALSPAVAMAEAILNDAPLPGVAREVGYTSVSDGTRIAYTIYRPEAAGRYPTVMLYDVYGAGSLQPGGIVREFVSHGYAFVGVNVRGTGCSEGNYVPYTQPDELRDGAELVDWVGSQSWSTGKVGLWGNSHPGIVQFGIAARHPEHLAAIAAGGIVAELYTDAFYPGGIPQTSIPLLWGKFGQPPASHGGAQKRTDAGDAACKERIAKIGTNSLWESLKRERFDSDYYRVGSPYERAPDIKVPALLVQSWVDPALESSALWVFDRLASKNKRLFVLTGGHESYDFSTSQAEVLRWMDRWVKGEKNGVDKEPRVRIDFGTRREPAKQGDIIPAKADATVNLKHWPAPDTQWLTYWLAADGKLEGSIKSAAAGAREYFYPMGTELPADNTRFAMVPTTAGALSYRSVPVERDTAIIGAPQLTFYASSDQPDTDFMALLKDVSAEGDATFVQRAYLRASRRAVDEKQSSEQRVVHPHTADEPLAPGQAYEFRLSFWPVAYVLRAGHTLELTIAAPSPTPSTAFEGLGLAPVMLAGTNTIYQDAEHPSQLKLPVVPSVRVTMPVPECGSLPFQPCRHAAQPAKAS